jgi:hypothetical protein
MLTTHPDMHSHPHRSYRRFVDCHSTLMAPRWDPLYGEALYCPASNTDTFEPVCVTQDHNEAFQELGNRENEGTWSQHPLLHQSAQGPGPMALHRWGHEE